MLCVIPHICKDAKYNSDNDHGKKFNNVIKTLFHGLYEDVMAFNQDFFSNEYTELYNKTVSFDGDEFIRKSKDIIDGKSYLWYQKYSLDFTKVLGFVSCGGKLKVLGIGAAE